MEKTTGWKVPLLFCAVITALITLLYPLVKRQEHNPNLPAPLLELAKSTHINLTGKAGKKWEDAIMEAASGFSSREMKDAKLLLLIKNALSDKNFEAACAALVHLRGMSEREDAMRDIFNSAIASCSTLHWGIIPIKGLNDKSRITELEQELNARWNECE